MGLKAAKKAVSGAGEKVPFIRAGQGNWSHGGKHTKDEIFSIT